MYSAADDGASLAGRMLPPRACAQLAQLAPPLRAVLLEEASSFALETLPQSAPLLLDAETLPRLCAPHLDWLARGDAAQCAAAVAALAECEACHAQAVDWPTLSTHGCRMKVLSYCPCGTCPEPKPEAVRVYTGDRSAVCFDGCAHPLAERDSLPLWGLARRVSLQEVVGFIASACPAAPTCAPVLACKALTPRIPAPRISGAVGYPQPAGRDPPAHGRGEAARAAGEDQRHHARGGLRCERRVGDGRGCA